MKKEYPVCPECGSEEVTADAFAAWDLDLQDWVFHSVYDSKTCQACGYESDNFNWVEVSHEAILICRT